MKPKKNLPFRALALFLCAAIAAADLGHAAPPAAGAPAVSRAAALQIPSSLLRVEESVQTDSGKTVIFIQDAHDVLEAQEKIAEAIHYLVEHEGVRTVFEEGYEGPVPTDAFFGELEPDIRGKVSHFLLDMLRIGGAEYAHINRARDFKLIGADGTALHLENILAYRKTRLHAPAALRGLEEIHAAVRNLIDASFPPEFKEWMRLDARFGAGEISITDYILRACAARPGICGKGKLPALAAVSECLNDPKGAACETSTPGSNEILAELDKLGEVLTGELLTGEREQALYRYDKQIRLLKKLHNLKTGPADYAAAEDLLKNFDTAKLARLLAAESGQSVVLSGRWEEGVQSALEFYRTAGKRDEFAAKAVDGFLRDPAEKTAVLVYGGFHQAAIRRILREKNVSYIIASPVFSEIDPEHQARYGRLMRLESYPFEMPLPGPSASRNLTLFLRARLIGDEAVQNEIRAMSRLAAEGRDLSLALRDGVPPASAPRSELRSENLIFEEAPALYDRLQLDPESWEFANKIMKAYFERNAELSGKAPLRSVARDVRKLQSYALSAGGAAEGRQGGKGLYIGRGGPHDFLLAGQGNHSHILFVHENPAWSKLFLPLIGTIFMLAGGMNRTARVLRDAAEGRLSKEMLVLARSLIFPHLPESERAQAEKIFRENAADVFRLFIAGEDERVVLSDQAAFISIVGAWAQNRVSGAAASLSRPADFGRIKRKASQERWNADTIVLDESRDVLRDVSYMARRGEPEILQMTREGEIRKTNIPLPSKEARSDFYRLLGNRIVLLYGFSVFWAVLAYSGFAPFGVLAGLGIAFIAAPALNLIRSFDADLPPGPLARIVLLGLLQFTVFYALANYLLMPVLMALEYYAYQWPWLSGATAWVKQTYLPLPQQFIPWFLGAGAVLLSTVYLSFAGILWRLKAARMRLWPLAVLVPLFIQHHKHEKFDYLPDMLGAQRVGISSEEGSLDLLLTESLDVDKRQAIRDFQAVPRPVRDSYEGPVIYYPHGPESIYESGRYGEDARIIVTTFLEFSETTWHEFGHHAMARHMSREDRIRWYELFQAYKNTSVPISRYSLVNEREAGAEFFEYFIEHGTALRPLIEAMDDVQKEMLLITARYFVEERNGGHVLRLRNPDTGTVVLAPARLTGGRLEMENLLEALDKAEILISSEQLYNEMRSGTFWNEEFLEGLDESELEVVLAAAQELVEEREDGHALRLMERDSGIEVFVPVELRGGRLEAPELSRALKEAEGFLLTQDIETLVSSVKGVTAGEAVLRFRLMDETEAFYGVTRAHRLLRETQVKDPALYARLTAEIASIGFGMQKPEDFGEVFRTLVLHEDDNVSYPGSLLLYYKDPVRFTEESYRLWRNDASPNPRLRGFDGTGSDFRNSMLMNFIGRMRQELEALDAGSPEAAALALRLGEQLRNFPSRDNEKERLEILQFLSTRADEYGLPERVKRWMDRTIQYGLRERVRREAKDGTLQEGAPRSELRSENLLFEEAPALYDVLDIDPDSWDAADKVLEGYFKRSGELSNKAPLRGVTDDVKKLEGYVLPADAVSKGRKGGEGVYLGLGGPHDFLLAGQGDHSHILFVHENPAWSKIFLPFIGAVFMFSPHRKRTLNVLKDAAEGRYTKEMLVLARSLIFPRLPESERAQAERLFSEHSAEVFRLFISGDGEKGILSDQDAYISIAGAWAQNRVSGAAASLKNKNDFENVRMTALSKGWDVGTIVLDERESVLRKTGHMARSQTPEALQITPAGEIRRADSALPGPEARLDYSRLQKQRLFSIYAFIGLWAALALSGLVPAGIQAGFFFVFIVFPLMDVVDSHDQLISPSPLLKLSLSAVPKFTLLYAAVDYLLMPLLMLLEIAVYQAPWLVDATEWVKQNLTSRPQVLIPAYLWTATALIGAAYLAFFGLLRHFKQVRIRYWPLGVIAFLFIRHHEDKKFDYLPKFFGVQQTRIQSDEGHLDLMLYDSIDLDAGDTIRGLQAMPRHVRDSYEGPVSYYPYAPESLYQGGHYSGEDAGIIVTTDRNFTHTLWHEYGHHAMALHLSAEDRARWHELFADYKDSPAPISDYSTENYGEAGAEFFKFFIEYGTRLPEMMKNMDGVQKEMLLITARYFVEEEGDGFRLRLRNPQNERVLRVPLRLTKGRLEMEDLLRAFDAAEIYEQMRYGETRNEEMIVSLDPYKLEVLLTAANEIVEERDGGYALRLADFHEERPLYVPVELNGGRLDAAGLYKALKSAELVWLSGSVRELVSEVKGLTLDDAVSRFEEMEVSFIRMLEMHRLLEETRTGDPELFERLSAEMSSVTFGMSGPEDFQPLFRAFVSSGNPNVSRLGTFSLYHTDRPAFLDEAYRLSKEKTDANYRLRDNVLSWAGIDFRARISADFMRRMYEELIALDIKSPEAGELALTLAKRMQEWHAEDHLDEGAEIARFLASRGGDYGLPADLTKWLKGYVEWAEQRQWLKERRENFQFMGGAPKVDAGRKELLDLIGSQAPEAAKEGAPDASSIGAVLENLQNKYTVAIDMDDAAALTDEQFERDFEVVALKHRVQFVFYNDRGQGSALRRERLKKLAAGRGSPAVVITASEAAAALGRLGHSEIIHVGRSASRRDLDLAALPDGRKVYRFEYAAPEDIDLIPLALLLLEKDARGLEGKIIRTDMVNSFLRSELREYMASLVIARSA